jgi:hypothetical protein
LGAGFNSGNSAAHVAIVAELPSADEFFSSAKPDAKVLPSADEFFGKPARVLDGMDAPQGTFESDMVWAKTTAKKVADKFSEGFGDAEIGLSDESTKALREYGVFNDYENGRGTVGKALNEVLLRPAASALDVLLRGTAAGFIAGQEVVKQGVSAVTGSESLGRDIAAMPEAFFGSASGIPAIRRVADLETARRLKIIGHGEEGWRGTATKVDDALPEQAMRAEEPQAPVAALPDAPQAKPIEEQRAFIIGDVKEKLVAAGRPVDEADAAAAIDAAYWETRAARFEGKKGTSEEMYRAEAPEIVAGKDQKALTLAQGGDTKRGRIRLREDGQNTITLLREANASTFIHEKGHDYLARLIADAADEAAPAILKQDADITLKWLGVEKAEDIKTKQHEQFARGFEAYMRDGVAPHPTLAKVFEQFRQWLVRIYQEVTRLKVDVNEDIRGVYDRLLAVNPERTGILPDEAIKKAAEKFGKLADSAEGMEAGILADAARAESAKLTENVGLGGTTEEARRSAAGRADADSPRPASEPIVERSGERPQPGTAGAGRSEVEAESARLRGDANASLPRAETPLTDKAGNIRLENLGTPEDVNAVLRQAASENEGFISARRGVLSDSEVSDLADALGMDAKTLDRRKIGDAFNAEQVVAARKLLVQSAVSVRDAMAKAAGGAEADVLAYAEVRARHLMIQEQVSGITAEAGRALRAFRAIDGMAEAKSLSAFLQENTGKTLYQLQREAQLGMQLDTSAKVSKYVRDSTKASWADMAVEVWINALLSGPKTHATNMLSNTLVALYRVPETVVAAGSGIVRTTFSANKERVYLGEAGARLFGIIEGSKDGVRAGWAVMKNEDLVEKASKIEQRRFMAIPGKAGELIRIPGRALAAEDQIFRGIAHRQELNALAYRKAMDEGAKGDKFARRVTELVQNPTEDMILAAQKNADYQTFQSKLGRIGGSVQQFANSHPMVKLVIPFVRTPVNIIKFAQERSVFGLFSRDVRENIAKGGASADEQIARMIMGSAVSTAAVAMALEGTITGGGPTDSKQRAVMFQTGWQPYSAKIGEHYYSFSRLEPLAMLLGIAGDMAEIAEVSTEKEADDVGKLVFASVTKNLTSKTWLSGPSNLITAVQDPDRYGQRYIQRFVGTVVPTGVAQIAQTQDPYLREARTIIDGIKARLPGLSQTLLPRRDIWGQPIQLGGGLGPDLVSPIYESRLNNDPVNQTLLRLGVFPARTPRKIRGVELTDEQYDDFARLAGTTTKMRLDQIVSMPGFASLPDFAQRELVTKTIERARETARSMMMMQNPDIINSAMEAKRSEIDARR